MSETKTPTSSEEAAQKFLGLDKAGPARTAESVQREMSDHLDQAALSDIATRTPEARMARRTGRLGKIIAAVTLTLGIGGAGAAALHDGPKPDTATYVTREGDSAWSIANKVEVHQDGIKGDDDILPIVENITEQVESSVLPQGEEIELPAVVDQDPDKPNIQL